LITSRFGNGAKNGAALVFVKYALRNPWDLIGMADQARGKFFGFHGAFFIPAVRLPYSLRPTLDVQ
jgi:hypothetical protein